jgi:hypothetical protein
MIVACYQLGIARFAALSLIEKVEALGKAAADFEKKLAVKGRKLGHPADHPSDYLAGIGVELLGAPPGSVPRDYQNDSDALFAANLPAKYLVRRLGSTLSAEEEKLVSGIGGLVIASHVKANDFIGFIGGMELRTLKPQTGAWPDFIQSKSLLAKVVQEYCGFGKVFVGSFSFVDASADLEYIDRGFGSLTRSKRHFSYDDRDIVVFAAGVEFSSGPRQPRLWPFRRF